MPKIKPKTTTPDPEYICCIGEKSLNHWEERDVIRILKREQDKGKPAWFDGSYFYLTGGKHEPYLDDQTNRFGIRFLHNLSLDGIFNHFPDLPCKYISHNQVAERISTERKEEDRKKREAYEERQKEEKHKADEETRKCYQLGEEIDQWIKDNTIKGRKGTFKIVTPNRSSLEPEEGTIYGLFGVHKPDWQSTSKEKYRVTHIPTGMGAGDFPSADSAKKWIFGISPLFNWDFKIDDNDSVPITMEMTKIRNTMKDHVSHNGNSLERLETLANLIRTKRLKIYNP